MLKKKRHETLAVALTVVGQGDKIKFNVVYKNLTKDQLEELSAKPELTMGDMVLGMIESWESEYDLTSAGMVELESDRPGMVEALLTGFHDARRMSKVKN